MGSLFSSSKETEPEGDNNMGSSSALPAVLTGAASLGANLIGQRKQQTRHNPMRDQFMAFIGNAIGKYAKEHGIEIPGAESVPGFTFTPWEGSRPWGAQGPKMGQSQAVSAVAYPDDQALFNSQGERVGTWNGSNIIPESKAEIPAPTPEDKNIAKPTPLVDFATALKMKQEGAISPTVANMTPEERKDYYSKNRYYLKKGS